MSEAFRSYKQEGLHGLEKFGASFQRPLPSRTWLIKADGSSDESAHGLPFTICQRMGLR